MSPSPDIDTAVRVLKLLDTDDDDIPTVLQVSRMFNVSPQRIYQILDAHNVTPPTKRGTTGEAA